MDHEKRIDKSVSFVAVNIAVLTVSDSRSLEDDKTAICWLDVWPNMATIWPIAELSQMILMPLQQLSTHGYRKTQSMW